MVNKLKEENKRLNDTLNENSLNSRQQSDQLVIKQEELDYIKQIKEENLKLKEALRFRERDMELKSTEYESVIDLDLFLILISNTLFILLYVASTRKRKSQLNTAHFPTQAYTSSESDRKDGQDQS